MNGLYWLPKSADFKMQLKAGPAASASREQQFDFFCQLAMHDLDFIQTIQLDRAFSDWQSNSDKKAGRPVRIAILSSSTADHLSPALRVGALRRGLSAEIYVSPFGQYRQELLNNNSHLHQFRPDVALFSFDPVDADLHVPLTASAQQIDAEILARIEEWCGFWEIACNTLGAQVIHQNIVIPPLRTFGNADTTIASSRRAVLSEMNRRLALMAAERGAMVFDADSLAAQAGKHAWCNLPLWYHAKQAIPPAFAPLWGDHVARILAASFGRAFKCIALDLDNTLWGGVIGDDGLEGIQIGQGDARSEAFCGFQEFLKEMSQRGILLAACSKNERENALLPFREHPEMLLKESDFAAFLANWDDKASNLERIALELNIGIDSIVFVDDNPLERDLVRRFLPAVAVPEMPEDPALYAMTLSDAGYFEAIRFTREDQARSQQYRLNREASLLGKDAGRLDEYLSGLNMRLEARRFDPAGRVRIAQLINKSNQFNLTTRRYTEPQVKAMEDDSTILTLQCHLRDRLADHGMISVVICRPDPASAGRALHIDTWLMSCRVLGRRVEHAVLNILVDLARRLSYTHITGEFIPTAKNSIVKDHYKALGFTPYRDPDQGPDYAAGGQTRWIVDVMNFEELDSPVHSEYLEPALHA